jgi:5-methylcytosine-specific restriction enzyme subunit McrC
VSPSLAAPALGHSVIELAEYQKRIVPLTRSDADALRLAAGNRLTVGLSTTDGHYELTATQHVGAIVTGNVSVAIRPKVPLHNMFLLLGVKPPEFDGTLFGFGQDADLLSVMAAVFTTAVDRATARGVHRGYRPTEERLASPRGRIDLVQQVRRPALVSPMACRFDEYTADHFPNRVLVAALDRLGRVPGLGVGLRIGLNRLAPRFTEVARVVVDPLAVDRWKPSRIDAHYETAMRLAALILRNLTLTHRSAATPAASFTVDMNDLFEAFVADRLAKHLRHLRLVTEPPVALATSSGLTMKPDLVFRHDDRDVYVGDTKYKMSTGPARLRDYYQLLAYATAMNLPEGVLIYAQDPVDPAAGSGQQVHTIEVLNSQKVIHTYRLPLTGSNADVELALKRLAGWIYRTVEQDPPSGRPTGDDNRLVAPRLDPLRG